MAELENLLQDFGEEIVQILKGMCLLNCTDQNWGICNLQLWLIEIETSSLLTLFNFRVDLHS